MVCDGVRCEVAFFLTRELTLKTNVTPGHVNDKVGEPKANRSAVI